jgi:two-component system CheB/CheR fusion protein
MPVEIIRRLEHELLLAESRLRTTHEESEAANEELRAANSALESINEEYRSTSTELETSRQELQSINSELQSVNRELKLKLESISRAHGDLVNMMAVFDFGAVLLDTSLRIKRFTPELSDIFDVATGDEGRPITDFTGAAEYQAFPEDARAVLRDLSPVEREVEGRKGASYLARMRPSRTLEGQVDGVVAIFVKLAERRPGRAGIQNPEV